MFWRSIMELVMSFGFSAVKWAWDNKSLLLGLGFDAFDFIIGIWA